MKTAITIPDETFARAEKIARQLRMSRSQLYTTAIERFLAEQNPNAITAQLNAVYEDEPSNVDPVFASLQ